MTIGEIIREYRKEHGLSQRQFASLCGDVSNGYISMIERGKNPVNGKPIILSVEKVAMFAHAMGMSMNQLVAMADDMPIDIGDSSAADKHASYQTEIPPVEIDTIEFALSGEIRELSEAGKKDVLQFARFIREKEAKERAAHDD